MRRYDSTRRQEYDPVPWLRESDRTARPGNFRASPRSTTVLYAREQRVTSADSAVCGPATWPAAPAWEALRGLQVRRRVLRSSRADEHGKRERLVTLLPEKVTVAAPPSPSTSQPRTGGSRRPDANCSAASEAMIWFDGGWERTPELWHATE